jgi:hypothetical protein
MGQRASKKTTRKKKALKDRGLVSQKTPALKLQPNQTDDFIKGFTAALEPNLSGVRNWEGEVHLEAHFGRILIRNIPASHIAPGDHHLSHRPDWLSHQLIVKGDLGEPICDFTNLVTAVYGDIQHLVSIKNAEEQRIWIDKPHKWAVTYQIECMRPPINMPFVVEVDAETFKHQVKSLPIPYGKVFVHGTMRNWDFNVATSAFKNLEEEYGGVGKDIIESLYIPYVNFHVVLRMLAIYTNIIPREDLDRIRNMSFSISHVHETIVNSIRVRRNAQYPSVDRKSVLNITEVNDLFIRALNLSPVVGSHAIYHGYTNDEKIQAPGPIWFEVGIFSTTAQELFKENQVLEFGDEVDWTTESMLSKGVAEAIYSPACEMLKQMDGVGFWNDKCPRLVIQEPTPQVASRIKTPEDKKLDPTMHEFW